MISSAYESKYFNKQITLTIKGNLVTSDTEVSENLQENRNQVRFEAYFPKNDTGPVEDCKIQGFNAFDKTEDVDPTREESKPETVVEKSKSNPKKKNLSSLETTVHSCNFCYRYFADKLERDEHQKLHVGAKPYQCNLCGKFSASSRFLKQHIRVHTPIRKHQCPVCRKQYKDKRYYSKHVRTHASIMSLSQYPE